MSLVLVFFFSISSCVDGLIYLAVDSAGWKALAHESLVMLYSLSS
jgi:hypothetical protein